MAKIIKKYRILERKLNWLKSNHIDSINIDFRMKKAEDKQYTEWSYKAKKHLPDLAKRVFDLRKKYNNRCSGLSYIEALLGRVILDLNSSPYHLTQREDRIAFRMLTEINVESLFKGIKEAEKI